MYDEIIAKAFEALKNAYAPYSGYHVGACVRCRDGRYFLGANIENASYGATSCAERNAIFSCYSNGYRKKDVEMIAIVRDGERIGTPCGICRQVLSELMPSDVPVVLSNGKETLVTNMQELLPMAFDSEDLIR